MSTVSRNASPSPSSTPRESKKTESPQRQSEPAASNTPKAAAKDDRFDASKTGTRPQVAQQEPTVPTQQRALAASEAQAVAPKSGPGKDGKLTVRVETGTSWTLTPVPVKTRNYIEIRVKPLDLKIPPGNLQAELKRAVAERQADDKKTYGADMAKAGYSSLEEWSKAKGYYGSPSHVAWAEAASARTNGQIPADWWMRFDAFGGTAGNGPHYDKVPASVYPGFASKIAMAHDTDWNLGRYFGTGPLSALRGAPNPEDLGPLGLDPRLGGDLYIFGHKDWDVTYGAQPILPWED